MQLLLEDYSWINFKGVFRPYHKEIMGSKLYFVDKIGLWGDNLSILRSKGLASMIKKLKIMQ